MNPIRLPHPKSFLLASASALALTVAAPHAYAGPLSERAMLGMTRQVNSTAPNPESGNMSAAQTAQIQQQLKQTTSDLSAAVTRLKAQLDAQAAARSAAQANGSGGLTYTTPAGVKQTLSGVADGLATGGMQVAPGATPGTVLWQGADAPTQAVSGGQTTVTINQTASHALLNWSSFNVGAKTTVDFVQKDATGADQSNWVALNRVVGSVAPSQILGKINAPGQIYILNQNGVIFGGSAQVSTGALVAAAANMTDQQFSSGLFSTPTGPSYNLQYTNPSLTDAAGQVIVQAGAQITTSAPLSVTQGGGFVLLAGTQVTNAGTITTPQGQTVMTAGDDFIIRPGISSTANLGSTTRGMEVAATLVDGSTSGTVTNSGLVESPEGDITMLGHTVVQDGDLLSTTSVSQRGTIHLDNELSDATGTITLAPDSLTTIQLDDSGAAASDAERSAAISTSETFFNGGTQSNPNDARAYSSPPFDYESGVFDRSDLSRIEITTGGTVHFQGKSLTLTPGGQLAVEAGTRIQVDSEAILDVAGADTAILPVSANQLMVNIQGNEQRDAPADRDSATLNNDNVYVDINDLVLVPAGTNGYTADRYYTPGGLLEVGGELSNTTHTIDEYMAAGGTIVLTGPGGQYAAPAGSIVAQSGSIFNISGGAIQYAGGTVKSSWVRGADGVLYNVDDAPANLLYEGLGNTFSVDHTRWVVSDNYSSISTLTQDQYQSGYIVGRDAGQLILSAPTTVFEGTIVGNVVAGANQTVAHPSTPVIDPYSLPQNVAPLAGTLAIEGYNQDKFYGPQSTNVIIGDPASMASGIGADDAIPDAMVGTTNLSAGALNSFGLGSLAIYANGSITVDDALTLANGGQLTLGATNLAVNADLTAHSGSISLVDYYTPAGGSYPSQQSINQSGAAVESAKIAPGVTLDTSGIFSNAYLNPGDAADAAFINGGAVTVSFNSPIAFGAGTAIDVEAGAAVSTSGKLIGGAGGNVTLALYDSTIGSTDPITLPGTIEAYGVTHGGTFTFTSATSIIVTNDPGSEDATGKFVLAPSFFQSGFSNYNIQTQGSITVAPGTQVDVAEPTYLLTEAAATLPTGTDPRAAMGAPVLQPLFLANPTSATLTQRAGASITLDAGSGLTGANFIGAVPSDPMTVGEGASITVDPKQSITLESYGAITVDGSLTAHGGNITLIDQQAIQNITDQNALSPTPTYDPTQPIWIGATATLDASGVAYTAQDHYGRTFGTVLAGGTIQLGGSTAVSDNFTGTLDDGAPIIVRPGAVLDVSGASATIDPNAGASAPGTTPGKPLLVASNAGAMTFNSAWGIYLDGDMQAHAGGPTAAGGTLTVNEVDEGFKTQGGFVCTPTGCGFTTPYIPEFINVPSEIVLSQTYTPVLGADVKEGDCVSACWVPSQTLGSDAVTAANVGKPTPEQAHLGVDQITKAGFDAASLNSNDLIVLDGNVSLKLGRSLALNGFIVASPDTPDETVSLTAPYIAIGANGTTFAGFRATYTPSLATGNGSLTFNADAIDILGNEAFGDSPTLAQTPGNPDTSVQYDFPGFANINFVSQGDIRLGGQGVASNGQGGSSSLDTDGNFSFTAAQVYPVMGQAFTILAGDSTDGTKFAGSTITFARSSDDTPAEPYTALGTLNIDADIIEQGGVLRSPEGILAFGTNGPAPASEVNFLPGSITSVSMNGLIVPFGGTTDGVTYTSPVNFADAFHPTPEGPSLMIQTASFNVSKGAVVDLSGGGTLSGAGFVSGRGGSTDTLQTPLFPSQSSGIYAIIPGYAGGYAPVAIGQSSLTPTGSVPGIGQQITVPAGVPGLPAGTYTLLPSYFALMPGAFRVELDGAAKPDVKGAVPLLNGSYQVAGNVGVANTSIVSSLPTLVTVTSGATVRTYSQYNEETYSQFSAANPATTQFGQVVGFIPEDGKEFLLNFTGTADGSTPLTFDGTGLFAAAQGGYAGSLTVEVQGNGVPSNIEITPDDATPTPGFVSLKASDINSFNAGSIYIGGNNVGNYYGTNNLYINGSADDTVLRTGAVLSAPQVFLLSNSGGAITVEGGATIDTTGKGAVYQDTTDGYVYPAPNGNVVAVSNGQTPLTGGGQGTTGSVTIDDGATLYSKGTIAFVSAGSLNLSTDANYGTSNLSIGSTYINIGTENAPGAAIPAGLDLSQDFLTKLLAGNPASGVPAMQTLTLSASDSVNFYGTVNLDTTSASGKSGGLELDLNTPAIMGYGGANDIATLHTGTLVWDGLATLVPDVNGNQIPQNVPPVTITNGPGTGSGTLNLVADTIVLGHAATVVPDALALDHSIFGFGTVNLIGITSIGANETGTLSVYESQQAVGVPGTGGKLNLITPLITGAAGDKVAITAGGAMTLTTPTGVAPSTATDAPLGAELDFAAASIDDNTAIVLPTGALNMNATGDITLGAQSRIDMSGRTVSFQDQTRYTWGGDASLVTTGGSISQAAGSVIDVSATQDNAGTLTVDAANGTVALDGAINGSAGSGFTAGGLVLRANVLPDFAALNTILNAGGVYGTRAFDIRTGDLTITDGELKAQNIGVSVDGGSLTVDGLVDAGGSNVGVIDLAAAGNLTLTGNAVLDAHGTTLVSDSYGQPIAASNIAQVELTSANGTIAIDSGAAIDVRSADDATIHRGDIEINAPRIGDTGVAVTAGNGLSIQGAGTTAVNAFRTYTPGDGIIDQTYLDGIDADSRAYIDGAQNGVLASLAPLGANVHFRPGVEIISAGDLTVQGDINLASFRYGPGATGNGAGEPGVLILRAAGNLNVHGSITDGFADAPASPDDNGWVVRAGIVDPNSGNIMASSSPITTPVAITLGSGTTFTTGSALSFNLPILGSTLAAGTPAPSAISLNQAYTIPAGKPLPAPATTTSDITIPTGSAAPGAFTIYNDLTLTKDWKVNVEVSWYDYNSGNFYDYQPGQTIPSGTTIGAYTSFPAGTVFAQPVVFPAYSSVNAGSVLPFDYTYGPGQTYPRGTVFATDVAVNGAAVRAGVALPAQITLAQSYTLNQPMVAGGTVQTPTHTYNKGDIIPAGTIFDTGTVVGVGVTLPFVASIQSMIWPAGAPLIFINAVTTTDNTTVPEGSVIPSGTGIVLPGGVPYVSTRPTGADGTQGSILALAPMLPAGAQSWSMQLVAGGDLAAADPATLQSNAALGGGGNIVLADLHYGDQTNQTFAAQQESISVIRTGTGSLQLLAGGSVDENSLFGVYTAGTQSPTIGGTITDPANPSDGRNIYDLAPAALPTDPAYAAIDYHVYYPDDGGNLTIKAQGDFLGYTLNGIGSNTTQQLDTGRIGNWLIRQGTDQGDPDQPTAWGINFGSYTQLNDGTYGLVGFNGFGALGGGNVNITTGGDFGNTIFGSTSQYTVPPFSTAVNVAAVGTGRVTSVTKAGDGTVTGGTIDETGGGNITLNVGGTINPVTSLDNLDGTVTDTRGDIAIGAGAMGSIVVSYGSFPPMFAYFNDPLKVDNFTAAGGIVLAPGDGNAQVFTRGDLVLDGVGDPTRVTALQGKGGDMADAAVSTGFSLWSPTTEIDLVSAGGNVDPDTGSSRAQVNNANSPANDGSVDAREYYPPILKVTAATGSIFMTDGGINDYVASPSPLELAPSPVGQVEMLAQQNIIDTGTHDGDPASLIVIVSGANAGPDNLSNPFKPAWSQPDPNDPFGPPASNSIYSNPQSLIAYTPDTITGNLHAGDDQPALFYAAQGDIVGLQYGATFGANLAGYPSIWYGTGKAVWMVAGGDIVQAGSTYAGGDPFYGNGSLTGSGIIYNANPSDVSLIKAGQDIVYLNTKVAGGGDLLVEAGRNIYQAGNGYIESIGPLVNVNTANRAGGAGVEMLAGVGAAGPDWTDFENLYLDPANQADTSVPLEFPQNQGKVAHVYTTELLAWMQSRYGYAGTAADVFTAFKALPATAQEVFLSKAYFDELDASDVEYNTPSSLRFQSYLRGRDAIASLFPDTAADGTPIAYSGDILMYGGSGVATDFGGDINIFTPGGATTIGETGAAVPPSTAGLITYGSGDVDIYSLGSVLLGQSRVFTTFGGAITIWSATGDINSGRGAKTTVVLPPPRIAYDNYDNITLSPSAPSTGAGIATLAPFAEVPPGNVYLIAPLGIIDAGEAGIRVSGNAYLAALQIVNAANIQVKGQAYGLPPKPVTNLALTTVSNATTEAVQMVKALAAQRQSTISVEVTGFGGDVDAPDECVNNPVRPCHQ